MTNASKNAAPKVGVTVGAERWPMTAAHPDCWGTPWAGVLLAADDPRAWAGSIAFPSATPDPKEVRQHVAWCRKQGLLRDKVPVLWDFGTHGANVFWELSASVRPYEEDLAAWEVRRAAARAEGIAREQAWQARQAEERRARAA